MYTIRFVGGDALNPILGPILYTQYAPKTHDTLNALKLINPEPQSLR